MFELTPPVFQKASLLIEFPDPRIPGWFTLLRCLEGSYGRGFLFLFGFF